MRLELLQQAVATLSSTHVTRQAHVPKAGLGQHHQPTDPPRALQTVLPQPARLLLPVYELPTSDPLPSRCALLPSNCMRTQNIDELLAELWPGTTGCYVYLKNVLVLNDFD